jgi:hypothetical protein
MRLETFPDFDNFLSRHLNNFPAEHPQTALSGLYREAGNNQCQLRN